MCLHHWHEGLNGLSKIQRGVECVETIQLLTPSYPHE